MENAASKLTNLDYVLEMMLEFILTYVRFCDVMDSYKPYVN